MAEKNRDTLEKTLVRIFAMIVHARIATAAMLFAVPGLVDELYKAMQEWAGMVACTQNAVVAAGMTTGHDRREMAERFVRHIFSPGDDDTAPFSRLNSLLAFVTEHGQAAAPKYLMRACRNYANDLLRRYQTRQKRIGCVRGYDQNGDYGVIDPGLLADSSQPSDPDEEMILRECMDEFLTGFGQDFVGDLVVLTMAAGIRRDVVTQYFFTGRVSELTTLVSHRLSERFRRDFTPQLEQLRAKARNYALPPRFRQDIDKLRSFLYRKTGTPAIEKLLRRWNAIAM